MLALTMALTVALTSAPTVARPVKSARVTVMDGNVVRALIAPTFACRVNQASPNPETASRRWTASPLKAQIETTLQASQTLRKKLLKM